MRWKDADEEGNPARYDFDATFTQEELGAVTPEQVRGFLAEMAYGTPNPQPEDCPTEARLNSLAYAKKAISYFMPNKHMQYNVLLRQGNPTQSPAVKELFDEVQRRETRGQGAADKSRRSFKMEEFLALLDGIRNSDIEDIRIQYGVPALFTFGFHMICRIDDCCQASNQQMRTDHIYPDICFQIRLNWSKNVRFPGDAPFQRCFGSMDARFCVLCNVGLYLEVAHSLYLAEGDKVGRSAMQVTPFLFAFSADIRRLEDGSGGAEKSKRFVQTYLKELLKEYVEADLEKLGTHSIRKFATSFARNLSISKDDVDFRARWRGQARQQDTYTDVMLPLVDATVAGALCVGGACCYTVVDPGFTDEWILTHVTPNIHRRFGSRELALLFGKALLWMSFDTEASKWMPRSLMYEIHREGAYPSVVNDDDGSPQPVRKELLTFSGTKDSLVITRNTVDGEDGNNPMGGSSVGGSGISSSQVAGAILSRLQQQEINQTREFQRVTAEITALRTTIKGSQKKVAQALQRLERHPVRMIRDNNRRLENEARGETEFERFERERRARATAPTNADLTKPNTLYDLWREWNEGIGLNKAAREFTAKERGGENKHKFHLRRVFWDVVEHLVIVRNVQASHAIEQIYARYGREKAVSVILKEMRKEKKDGCLPSFYT